MNRRKFLTAAAAAAGGGATAEPAAPGPDDQCCHCRGPGSAGAKEARLAVRHAHEAVRLLRESRRLHEQQCQGPYLCDFEEELLCAAFGIELHTSAIDSVLVGVLSCSNGIEVLGTAKRF